LQIGENESLRLLIEPTLGLIKSFSFPFDVYAAFIPLWRLCGFHSFVVSLWLIFPYESDVVYPYYLFYLKVYFFNKFKFLS